MGYQTDFFGQFDFNKPLDDSTYKFLVGLASTRRMKRDNEKLKEKYNRDFGTDGEYFCEVTENFGQVHDDTVVEYNQPPRTQPSLWLQWIPTEDRLHLEWDGNEKFYEYIEWLEYLIKNIIAPRGYILNGEVEWEGEERGDTGRIEVVDNIIKVDNIARYSVSDLREIVISEINKQYINGNTLPSGNFNLVISREDGSININRTDLLKYLYNCPEKIDRDSLIKDLITLR